MKNKRIFRHFPHFYQKEGLLSDFDIVDFKEMGDCFYICLHVKNILQKDSNLNEFESRVF
ncbi:hypothetical protein DMB65_20045 [Flavobacterium cheongpyeongense]|uniref:Uncharacterized protein n=1 Tax=Flavobacterium cheongpyeongense TaxID=2212651 RepID=A0A2V4BLT2_9FLAO|nr:hypothetical protein DMB65_20045 [Flavobacterium cheongpyeongense]